MARTLRKNGFHHHTSGFHITLYFAIEPVMEARSPPRLHKPKPVTSTLLNLRQF
ncbi:MAG: hypothetical protein ACFCBU_03660 [Cyanophyceae cyanobacterium]